VVLVERNNLLGWVQTESLVNTAPFEIGPTPGEVRVTIDQATLDGALLRARRAVR